MPGNDYLQMIWKQIRGYLRISHTVTDKVGVKINAGEPFTLKLTLLNATPMGPAVPYIRFKNATAKLVGTPYASLAVGQASFITFPDVDLKPGEATSIPVKMKAEAELPEAIDPYQVEKVLKVDIFAQVDLSRLPIAISSIQYEEIYELT